MFLFYLGMAEHSPAGGELKGRAAVRGSRYPHPVRPQHLTGAGRRRSGPPRLAQLVILGAFLADRKSVV